jgi:SH3 domain protein
LRIILSLLAILAFCASTAYAQDVRYVSDVQYIPLRSGPGGEYRITHRGIPSGTRLVISSRSEDGLFAEITTEKGTKGWIRTQYLMDKVPAQVKLDKAQQRVVKLQSDNAGLASETSILKTERVDVLNQIQSTDGQLDTVSRELAGLKKISGNAVQLDTDNRRLIVESETMKSDLEMIRAENQRLTDRLASDAFINGALAVLLGVIITLAVPRLWPKRRRNSDWA